MFNQISFTDKDIVNIDDWIPGCDKYNPHRVRPWLIHEAGFTVAIVFASCEQDALEEAADSGKLDKFMIDPEDKNDRDDYMIEGVVSPGHDKDVPEYVDGEGKKYWWRQGREPAFLGDASEPFDIESLSMVKLPNPPLSFVACFQAAKSGDVARKEGKAS